jgi:hypothetical protein
MAVNKVSRTIDEQIALLKKYLRFILSIQKTVVSLQPENKKTIGHLPLLKITTPAVQPIRTVGGLSLFIWL